MLSLVTAAWVWAAASAPVDGPCAPCIEALGTSRAETPSLAASLAWGLAGAATGFVTHEAGHLLANAAYGNRPDFVGLTAFGFIPFFAISPDIDCDENGCTDRTGAPFAGGRRGKYLISVAGFLVGDISSEIILGTEPCLRYKQAPFRVGWLAFNVLLSVGYSLASVTNTEPGNGDAGGASAAADMSRPLFAGMLVAPALMDAYRFFWPGSSWVPWVSRSAKAAMVGVAFTF